MSATASYQSIYPNWFHANGHVNEYKIGNAAATKITVDPRLEVGVENDHATIKFEGKPGIALSERSLKDSRNLGPFIERIVYTIQPVSNAVFQRGDPGGTKENSYEVTYSKSKSWSVSGNGLVQPLQAAVPLAQGSVTFGTSSCYTASEPEFSESTYRDGSEISWVKEMSLYYDGGRKTYNKDDLECLRSFQHGSRVGTIFSFGIKRWENDGVLDVPEAAKSSLQWSTMATYGREANKESVFKIFAVATVVLVSNECKNPSSGSDDSGDYLYWIRSKHQVEKTVTISSNNTNVESTPFSHSQSSDWGYTKRVHGEKKYRHGWQEE